MSVTKLLARRGLMTTKNLERLRSAGELLKMLCVSQREAARQGEESVAVQGGPGVDQTLWSGNR